MISMKALPMLLTGYRYLPFIAHHEDVNIGRAMSLVGSALQFPNGDGWMVMRVKMNMSLFIRRFLKSLIDIIESIWIQLISRTGRYYYNDLWFVCCIKENTMAIHELICQYPLIIAVHDSNYWYITDSLIKSNTLSLTALLKHWINRDTLTLTVFFLNLFFNDRTYLLNPIKYSSPIWWVIE